MVEVRSHETLNKMSELREFVEGLLRTVYDQRTSVPGLLKAGLILLRSVITVAL